MAKVFSCTFDGLNCQLVEVEADISPGMPSFSIVGLGDASVQESRERVRLGIKNSGAQFSTNRKTVNLAPAEIRKQGSLFDLPIAVALLIASDQIFADELRDSLIVGELSLSGKIKNIHGALAITQFAKEQNFKKIFLPAGNALEASFIDGIEIYPLKDLRELINFCNQTVDPHLNNRFLKPAVPTNFNNFLNHYNANRQANDFVICNIIGLHKAKRALSIAAAGGHNILLSGPPGTGKTILARAFADLLPNMAKEEILETSKIFSIAGMLDQSKPLIVKRPFREVHHTASLVSIVGGIKPGEITLAHNGVLFFDEITEFPRKILEALRQPLEDKYITITRSKFSYKFPCNFIFVAAMNPCPCGYHGAHSQSAKCRCTESQIRNYQRKLSGPILDRFDIFLDVPLVHMRNIFEDDKMVAAEPSPEKSVLQSKSQIEAANLLQKERFINQPHINKNSDMQVNDIKIFCRIDKETQAFLDQAAENMHISNRGYFRILKLARTIADMNGSTDISYDHLAEALQYRKNYYG